MVRTFGPAAYPIGASVTLLGVAVLGISMLVREGFPKSAPVLWIVSLIIGLVGLFPLGINWGVALAGVMFGLRVHCWDRPMDRAASNGRLIPLGGRR